MIRKKAVIDAAIKRADQEKGLLLILTGSGKGKSTSAFGMVARAIGHGMKVGVVQFIKSPSITKGEESFLSRQPGVEWHTLGDGYTWDNQDLAESKERARSAWQVAQEMIRDSSFQLIVLDELTYLINYGWIDQAMVIDTINNRPPHQHVIITGRAASNQLIEAADTVSEIKDVKHAFRSNIKAQPGIDL